jgi:hypothetical protein
MRRLILAVVVLVATGAGPATRPATAPAARPAKVVFLLDSSGTMIRIWDDAVTETAKGIDGLAPNQQFSLIVAAEGKIASLGGPRLPATEENKKKAWDFLQKHDPKGMDANIGAFELAAKLRPDVVWFVTDGSFNGLDTYERVEQIARDGRFRVNVIDRFADPGGPTRDELRNLANRTGGASYDDDGHPIPDPSRPRGPASRPTRERPRGPGAIRQ